MLPRVVARIARGEFGLLFQSIRTFASGSVRKQKAVKAPGLRFQPLLQLFERIGTVADLVFFVFGELRVGAVEAVRPQECLSAKFLAFSGLDKYPPLARTFKEFCLRFDCICKTDGSGWSFLRLTRVLMCPNTSETRGPP